MKIFLFLLVCFLSISSCTDKRDEECECNFNVDKVFNYTNKSGYDIKIIAYFYIDNASVKKRIFNT